MRARVYGGLAALVAVLVTAGCSDESTEPPKGGVQIHPEGFRISGSVMSAAGGQPIGGIELRLQRLYSQPATSGADGAFLLEATGYPECQSACELTALDADGEAGGGEFRSQTKLVDLQATSDPEYPGGLFAAADVLFELELASGGMGGSGGAAGAGGSGGAGGAGGSGGFSAAAGAGGS